MVSQRLATRCSGEESWQNDAGQITTIHTLVSDGVVERSNVWLEGNRPQAAKRRPRQLDADDVWAERSKCHNARTLLGRMDEEMRPNRKRGECGSAARERKTNETEEWRLDQLVHDYCDLNKHTRQPP